MTAKATRKNGEKSAWCEKSKVGLFVVYSTTRVNIVSNFVKSYFGKPKNVNRTKCVQLRLNPNPQIFLFTQWVIYGVLLLYRNTI